MLTLKFGTYTHLLGENTVQIGRSTQYSEANRPIKVTETWTIGGRVEGDNLIAVVVELVKLNLAYEARNQYPVVRLVDENGVIAHALNGPASIGGIRVDEPPSYPNGQGAQLSTYRDYQIRLSADFFVGNPARAVVSFDETLTFEGGGPDRGLIELTSGPPVEYVTTPQTVYRCTQVGRAVGLVAYPMWVVKPAFPPGLFEGRQPPLVYGSPKAEGFTNTMFPVSWQYRFASARPLRGLPRPFPRS